MASQAATSANGNLKKALAGLRRINLEGLRWRVFDAKDQMRMEFSLASIPKLLIEYVGNLKERSLKDQIANDPTEVIRKAVLRMLPRNKLQDDRARKLRIFAGGEHPFGDQPLESYVIPTRSGLEIHP